MDGAPPLLDTAKAFYELFANGGMTVVTPLDPPAGAAGEPLPEGTPIGAVTVIQPNGSILVRVSEQLMNKADWQDRWARHQKDVAERLLLLVGMRDRVRRADRLVGQAGYASLGPMAIWAAVSGHFDLRAMALRLAAIAVPAIAGYVFRAAIKRGIAYAGKRVMRWINGQQASGRSPSARG
jgi:hypothetical protein